jgi:predicted ATP-dependent serine protease
MRDNTMTNPTKLCPACGCEKPLEEFREFWDCINQRYRRRGKCSKCRNFAEQVSKEKARKARPVTVRAKEREKARRYRQNNREKYDTYHREYKQKQKMKKFQEMLGRESV